MGVFGLFGKKKSSKQKGYYSLSVSRIEKLNSKAVTVEFSIPEKLRSKFSFQAGQYLNIIVHIDQKEYRRSYSICTHPGEAIKIAIKRVEGGVVSNWFNDLKSIEEPILVSEPQGNFVLPKGTNDFTAIAAGSGITPIMSILKSKEENQAVHFIYGNKTAQEALFLDEINSLSLKSTSYFYSREKNDGFLEGRIDKASLTKLIKDDLSILKNDCFLICGPEDMIHTCIDTLKFFGVAENKIIYELFTTPAKPEEPVQTESFVGTASVTVTLDDEEISFELDGKGSSVLDAVEEHGLDAPFSCRGGVCCSCKARVLEGSVSMTLNYSLTDEEVEEGYILTCQSHPSSEVLKITYDE